MDAETIEVTFTLGKEQTGLKYEIVGVTAVNYNDFQHHKITAAEWTLERVDNRRMNFLKMLGGGYSAAAIIGYYCSVPKHSSVFVVKDYNKATRMYTLSEVIVK